MERIIYKTPIAPNLFLPVGAVLPVYKAMELENLLLAILATHRFLGSAEQTAGLVFVHAWLHGFESVVHISGFRRQTYDCVLCI